MAGETPRDQSEAFQPLSLPARAIPVPKSVSPQAQNFLAGAGAQPMMPPDPPAADKEAWRARIAAGDAGMLRMMPGMGAEFDGSIETLPLGGAKLYRLTPKSRTGRLAEVVYLDIHGGALIMGGGELCRRFASSRAAVLGAQVVSVDYRMAPDHPYPAPLDDCVAAYREVLKTHRPADIVVGGASAGGNLSAAMVLRARDEGLPLPAGLCLITPELDLTESGDSFETHQMIDVTLRRRLTQSIALHANGHDLSHPYLSPLFGDFAKGFPPTYLTAGTRDLFLSNAARMQRFLRRAGVPVELHIGEAMPHGGFLGSAPEDKEMDGEFRRFVHERWRV